MMKKLCIIKLCLLFLMFFVTIDVNASFHLNGKDWHAWPMENSKDVKKIYIASGKKMEFEIFSYTSRMVVFDQLVEDTKLVSLDVNISSSSGITCNVTNLQSNYYSLSGNKFTLINNNYGELDTVDHPIGRISCSFPSTDSYIPVSKNMWLKVEVKGNDKNFAQEEDNITSSRELYSYNFGIINENYVKSLNHNTSIESVTIDGKVFEQALKVNDVNQSSIKLNVARNNLSSKNKIILTVETAKNVIKLNEELKVQEKSIDLSYGQNIIEIKEQTERDIFINKIEDEECDELLGFSNKLFDSSRFSYVYIFNRIDNRSKVNTLKSLAVSNAVISFKPELTNYIASVPYKVSSVRISSILTDSKSSYVKGYGNRTVNLKEGLNNVLVKVKAENGKEKTYTIKITREKNDDSSLKTITVDDKVINIKEGILKYELSVDNEIVNPKISAVANDSKAKVAIDKVESLQEGSNEVSIIVTASNGMKSVYVIDIIRDKLISTNAQVENIIIKNHELNFDSEKYEYTLKLENKEKKLDIDVITEHEKAKVLITGNKELKNESVIKIKVTAEDEVTTKTYIIKIEKDLNILKYLVIILPILLIVIIIIIISRKKKKNNQNTPKETEVVINSSLNNNNQLNTSSENLSTNFVNDSQMISTNRATDNSTFRNNINESVNSLDTIDEFVEFQPEKKDDN